MITYITHLRVPPQNAAAFEAALAEMERNVAAHEPGVIHYALSKSDSDPELYMVVEVYRDEAAFKAHWETDFIRPSLAKTQALIVAGSTDTKRYVSAQ